MPIKCAMSAKETRLRPGRKRYRSVWRMAHKPHGVMGERDSLPLLHGDMEMDEGFFPNETIEEQIQLCLAEFCYKFNPTISCVIVSFPCDGHFDHTVELVLENPVSLLDVAQRESMGDERRGVNESLCD